MKKTVLILFAICAIAAFAANKKIYINPGHGSWGPNDRPMATIPYPNLSSTGRPDTCGFYESNTNLWKGFELARRLQKDGYTIKMSRYANGPYPYTSASTKYNRNLSEICQEVESWGGDMFLSIHSNAASDGSTANYPLFLYRGQDNGGEQVPGSINMCKALWPYLVECMKSGFEYQSYYNSSTNIRGDWDFYHSYSTSSLGYTGYLGVLKHGTPGFLSEGYFHTYQPARHRALNPDYCYQEGLRYYRGIVKYFGTTTDKKGYIMGLVKDMAISMDGKSYFTYKNGTHDAYQPVNGATVRLRNANGEQMGIYTVDNKYNGLFAFYDLEPGTYYIDLKAPGYATQQGITNKVTVTANATTYPILYMKQGISSPFETVDGTVKLYATGAGSIEMGSVKVHNDSLKAKTEVNKPVSFKFVPDEGAYLESASVNGMDITNQLTDGTYSISSVTANLTVKATFKKYVYNITFTCPAYGKLELPDTTRSGRFTYEVEAGDTLQVRILPKDAYEVKQLKVDNVDITSMLQTKSITDPMKYAYTFEHVMKAHTFAVTYQTSSYTTYDINGDGSINAADLTMLVAMIMSNYDIHDKYFMAGDVDGDGKLTAADLTALVNEVMMYEK